MTEPTADRSAEPKPPPRRRKSFGEEGSVAGRALTVGLAIVLAGAVAVGVVTLVSRGGDSGRSVDAASAGGSVSPGSGQAAPPAPTALTGPSRRPAHAPPSPPRHGRPGDPAGSKRHHATAPASPGAASRALVSYQSGRCVDGGGAPLRIWDCDGSARQRWVFASDGTLRSQGRCMTLAGGSSADGTAIQLARCTGGAAQRFVLKSALDLVNIAADKCVDVKDQKTTDGTRLQLWRCAGASNQKWHT